MLDIEKKINDLLQEVNEAQLDNSSDLETFRIKFLGSNNNSDTHAVIIITYFDNILLVIG